MFRQLTINWLISILMICPFLSLAHEFQSFKFGSFGSIRLFHPPSSPNNVILFISGDGGWEKEDNIMASFFAQNGSLVAGIDAKYYKNTIQKQHVKCLYPAADFEQLSMALQKTYAFKNYMKPILVGYSYGATLVYAILAQAPQGTFQGGIGLGFCPDIVISKPLCSGTGLKYKKIKNGYLLDAIPSLSAPFIALNGMDDQICNLNATNTFIKQVKNAAFIPLEKVGHGFTNQDAWYPKVLVAYQKISHQNNSFMKNEQKQVTNLPLYQTNPKKAVNKQHLLFFISGDGGWTSFDQGLSEAFANSGVTVIGLDAQKYFWKKKTVQESANAANEVINNFLAEHQNYSVSMMGFSFGACVIPFISSQLSTNRSLNIKNMILLSPDKRGEFEIHIADMLNFGNKTSQYDVVKESSELKNIKKLALFGKDEDQSVIKSFQKAGIPTATLAGGHHYNNDYDNIVKHVLQMTP